MGLPSKLALGGILVSAFSTFVYGLVAFLRWRSEITPEDKLMFSGVLIEQIKINNVYTPLIKIAFDVQNIAGFVIEFEVEELYTEVENVKPSHLLESIVGAKFPVFPGRNFIIWDRAIDLKNVPKRNQTLQGHIYAKIKYGRPGNLSYHSDLINSIFVDFDEQEVYAGHQAYEINRST